MGLYNLIPLKAFAVSIILHAVTLEQYLIYYDQATVYVSLYNVLLEAQSVQIRCHWAKTVAPMGQRTNR